MGSAIAVWISKFKTNTGDPTIGLSIIAVRSLNADFDGVYSPSYKLF